MNTYPIYQVNAFTDQSFSGNPAAVVIMDAFPEPEIMLGIAADNNLAETAFTVPNKPEDADFLLRWFTPTLEIDLCGHATLATAAVYFEQLGWDQPEIRFKTLYGILTVEKRGDQYVMDFPAIPCPQPLPSKDFGAIDGAFGPKFTIYELASSQEVRDFEPDFVKISEANPQAVIVTAQGGEGDTTDVVSRMFGPNLGIPEDPVTGAAHCALALYWSERLGKTDFTAEQASHRRGFLQVSLKGDRVELIGQAVLYLEGKITV